MKLPIISSTPFATTLTLLFKAVCTPKVGLCSCPPHHRSSSRFYPCVHCVCVHCTLTAMCLWKSEYNVPCRSWWFTLFKTVPCIVHRGLHQASRLVSFQGSSCLYLSPHHWALGLMTRGHVFGCMWFCGSHLRPSHMCSEHCARSFTSSVPRFILIPFSLFLIA